MKLIDTIKTPTLHTEWEAAKKATKAAAKLAREEAAYTALASEFKRNLGPSLDKWHQGFPDGAKLAKAVLALQETITAYSRAISKSGLGTDRRKILTRCLESASGKVEEHYRLACQALTGGDDAAKQIAEAARKARIYADVQATSLRSAIQHALVALKSKPLDARMVEFECSKVEALLNGTVKKALAQAREVHLKAQKWLHEHKEELAANKEYRTATTDTAALLLEVRATAEVYDDGFKVAAAMKKAVADATVKTPARV